MDKPITKFTTHTGEVVEGERLTTALNAVADFWVSNSNGIYKEDAYASHVTQETKDLRLKQGLDHAERVRSGIINNFTDAQRLDTELTGECVAMLS